MKKPLPTICAAVAALGLAATAAPAHAATRHNTLPTKAARLAGITALGGGYAGWKQHAEPSRSTSLLVGVTAATRRTLGVDVSAYQGNVNWSAQWKNGVRWAYTKATEGTYYKNAYFNQQYNGAYNVGMIRGAYHFANPAYSSPVSQADYFVAHGGGWSKDGKTLPGMLDIEYNPYGATCFGKTKSQMVSWIRSFLNEYKRKTGRDAVIYTTTGWWQQCTGNSTAFNSTNPLWVARYSSSAGTLPGGWPYYTMWQFTDSPIDQDLFNGDISRVRALATG
ncbi:lysozyme [Flexivirga oryzae]|uniref:lysozyme n=1 Tax=Flexivirga oryzae TaxID=1794944 RepID=A0A839NEE6_9MICO|nr:lysozyme [Flexivirga oryzae]MBB2893061.1 GH25 family lysozyme M1 (1,4-beta-N-acetylmuramidase) [Flexivirga oryzae]